MDEHDERLLLILIQLQRDNNELQRENNALTHTGNEILREILKQVKRPDILGFTPIIPTSLGGTMALLPISPGFTPGFSTTTVPAGTVPNPSALPVWTSSDPTNAPLQPNTADPLNLSTFVAIPSTAAVGTVFGLTIKYTNADGTVAAQTNSFTIVAPPPPDITGFTTITQDV
jgi:hypothetical protein